MTADVPVRVLGHVDALRHREPVAGEQRLQDVVAEWSRAANEAWLADGVRTRAVFRVVSAARPGSVLAAELDHLRAAGYVRLGGHLLPKRWWTSADGYRRAVLAVASGLPGQAPVYGTKVCGELEPLLGLWPHVLLWPTAGAVSRARLVRQRAVPVHPLGVVAAPAWADGAPRSPAEFFWHDVDHARFKVREDLQARGVAVPDAYVDGSTWDAAAGRHRTFVAEAAPHVGAWTWAAADVRRRAALARHLLPVGADGVDPTLAEAVAWLAFELVHEKSLPLVGEVLRAALVDSRHVDKLTRKAGSGFYAEEPPPAAVVARFADARHWLSRRLEGTP